jgi:membrane protein
VVLQKWFVVSLIPDAIAQQVLGYLTQFARKANKLGSLGVVLLLMTALALFFTIDRTLNNIWRVRKPRPFAQRVLIYWAAVTLGPLLLGASLSLTSLAVSGSKGLLTGWFGGVGLLLEGLQFALIAVGMACMFRFVPHTHVRWGHAWMGGIFVAAGLELAKKLLMLYLSKVPTYSVVYGAFATVPILLIWVYVAWVIVLLGAALTAHVPSLLAGVARRRGGPGWQFQLALEVLQQLHQARSRGPKGLCTFDLQQALRVDFQRLEPVLEALSGMDWIGRLDESGANDAAARYVLLIDPAATPLRPLCEQFLLAQKGLSERLWQTAWNPHTTLQSVW